MKRIVLYSLAVCICSFSLSNSAFASSTTQSAAIEVPFRLERGTIVLPVMIRGRGPFNLLLSTGSKTSMLSFDILRDIGLQAYFSYENNDPRTQRTVSFVRASDIQVGDLRVSSLTMNLGGFSDASQNLGVTIHGVLGYTFLRGRIVQIDYANRMVRFLQTSPTARQSTGVASTVTSVTVPFEILDDHPIPILEEVSVGGREMKALLDTGQGITLALTPAAIRQLELPATERNQPPRIGTVNMLRVGALQVESPQTAFYAQGAGFDHGLRRYGAIIGAGFLANYIVTLDYRRREVIFEQRRT